MACGAGRFLDVHFVFFFLSSRVILKGFHFKELDFYADDTDFFSVAVNIALCILNAVVNLFLSFRFTFRLHTGCLKCLRLISTFKFFFFPWFSFIFLVLKKITQHCTKYLIGRLTYVVHQLLNIFRSYFLLLHPSTEAAWCWIES